MDRKISAFLSYFVCFATCISQVLKLPFAAGGIGKGPDDNRSEMALDPRMHAHPTARVELATHSGAARRVQSPLIHECIAFPLFFLRVEYYNRPSVPVVERRLDPGTRSGGDEFVPPTRIVATAPRPENDCALA